MPEGLDLFAQTPAIAAQIVIVWFFLKHISSDRKNQKETFREIQDRYAMLDEGHRRWEDMRQAQHEKMISRQGDHIDQLSKVVGALE